jgi:hypothetical protein
LAKLELVGKKKVKIHTHTTNKQTNKAKTVALVPETQNSVNNQRHEKTLALRNTSGRFVGNWKNQGCGPGL